MVDEVRGACLHDCPDGCSMLYAVENGAVTSVRGNPDHPFTRGGLCVKVNHYEERVHSPDRVVYPLKRMGQKGRGEFQRISWEEALQEIGERWRGLIEELGPQSIMPYAYMGSAGMLNGAWSGDAFFNRLGSTIPEKTFCDSGATTAYMMTMGPAAGLDSESFVHSRYIILWAQNTLSTSLHHWPFIAEAQKNGAKVVVIDPVRTRTAKKADWHIAPRPGTDGALALGLIHVIVGEKLHDEDFVVEHTVGFDELAERAREFSPERVSEITGVSADDIRMLAREYATTGPAAIRIGVAIERHSGGGQAVRAITALPALVGAWRDVGGGIYQLPVWPAPVKWDTVMRPDWIQPGTRVINQWQLGPALLGEIPEVQEPHPPLRSMFIYNTNPVVVAPEQDKIVAGLSRDDLFTVVHEQFLTDTARYADIVLPACTMAEHLDVMVSWGNFYINYNRPAIAPIGEAVSNTELFRRLARAMRFDERFFERNDEQILEETFDWSAPAVADNGGLETLKQQGYVRYVNGSPDEYAPYRDGGFPTPSGKVELKSAMAEGGNMVVPIFRQGSMEFQDATPVDPVPHYIPPQETATDSAQASKYPLAILSPKSHALLNSQYANLARQKNLAGEQQLVLHPEDATSRAITDDDRVRVFNDRGSFDCVARVSDEVLPGVVLASVGHWAGDHSRRTVAAVGATRYADLGRAPTFSDTRVQVERAE